SDDERGVLGRTITKDPVLGPRDSTQDAHGFSYLLLSNEIAQQISRPDYTHSRVATREQQNRSIVKERRGEKQRASGGPDAGAVFCSVAVRITEERLSWVEILQAEEIERLKSLRARMNAFKAEGKRTHSEINALLVSAVRGQIALLTMSRVYPDVAFATRMDLTWALGHHPTVVLASELCRCWRLLGVTDSTLKAILRRVVADVGRRTRLQRAGLFLDAARGVRRGVDLKAEESLVAEGLGGEDEQGLLGQVIAKDCQGDGSPRTDQSSPETSSVATNGVVVSADDSAPGSSPVERDPVDEADASSYLVLSNEVAVEISRSDYTLSRIATAKERKSWIDLLEAEEIERLRSLRASMNAIGAEGVPTSSQINALVVSALQGQVTLMKMSRVFYDPALNRRMSLTRALRHSTTVALACELRRSWRILGVTDATLKLLLRHAVTALGSYTRDARARLFTDPIPSLRQGTDAKAHAALVAEGSAFAAAIQEWNPVAALQIWVADGDLPLTSEDERGVLGRLLAGDCSGRCAQRHVQSSPRTDHAVAGVSASPLIPGALEREQLSAVASPLAYEEELQPPRSPTEAGEPPSPDADKGIHVDELAGALPTRSAPAPDAAPILSPAPSPKAAGTQVEQAASRGQAVVTDSSTVPRRKKLKSGSDTDKTGQTGGLLAAASSPTVSAKPKASKPLKRVTLSRAPKGPCTKRSKWCPGPDQVNHTGESLGPPPAAELTVPRPSAIPEPVWLPQGGGRGSVRGPARRSRSGDQTTVGQEAGAIRADKSGPWKAAEHVKAQEKPRGRPRWGLGGLPSDSGVPVSQIISEFIDRHFSRAWSSPPPQFSTGDQGLDLEEHTGLSDDSVVLISQGMGILKDLGITDISADRASLLEQARVLSKLMEDVGLRPPNESAPSVYTGLSPEHIAFVRCQTAQRLERRFSDTTAAVRRHGRSSVEARQGWRGFQKELRHLTTLTLLMTGLLRGP
ncbi:hypothetical protein CSUI_003173, partial [Cystoisospora suis]